VVFRVHVFWVSRGIVSMDLHVMKPIKGLVNSIVNGPRGKRLRLTWSDLVKVFRMQSFS
jgi:hypothetical protein